EGHRHPGRWNAHQQPGHHSIGAPAGCSQPLDAARGAALPNHADRAPLPADSFRHPGGRSVGLDADRGWPGAPSAEPQPRGDAAPACDDHPGHPRVRRQQPRTPPSPPQQGLPLRLFGPGWYGMAHVKWLRGITVLGGSSDGCQQASAYHYRRSDDDPGEPVTRMLPRALMIPPGIPDFMSRIRFVSPSHQVLMGRAWSGLAPIKSVELSADGARTWSAAELGESVSPYAWRS